MTSMCFYYRSATHSYLTLLLSRESSLPLMPPMTTSTGQRIPSLCISGPSIEQERKVNYGWKPFTRSLRKRCNKIQELPPKVTPAPSFTFYIDIPINLGGIKLRLYIPSPDGHSYEYLNDPSSHAICHCRHTEVHQMGITVW